MLRTNIFLIKYSSLLLGSLFISVHRIENSGLAYLGPYFVFTTIFALVLHIANSILPRFSSGTEISNKHISVLFMLYLLHSMTAMLSFFLLARYWNWWAAWLSTAFALSLSALYLVEMISLSQSKQDQRLARLVVILLALGPIMMAFMGLSGTLSKHYILLLSPLLLLDGLHKKGNQLISHPANELGTEMLQRTTEFIAFFLMMIALLAVFA